MPTVEINESHAAVLREQVKRLDKGTTISPQTNSFMHRILSGIVDQFPEPVKPLAVGDRVQSTINASFSGILVDIEGDWAVFKTGTHQPGQLSPFVIALLTHVERV